jgi:hypothetical protein
MLERLQMLPALFIAILQSYSWFVGSITPPTNGLSQLYFSMGAENLFKAVFLT